MHVPNYGEESHLHMSVNHPLYAVKTLSLSLIGDKEVWIEGWCDKTWAKDREGGGGGGSM